MTVDAAPAIDPTAPLDEGHKRRIPRVLRPPQHSDHARRFFGLLIVFLVLSGFFYWSGTSSANPVEIGGPQNDFYNQLADGFLHGHLYLPTEAPRSLLDSPNPYAPPCCDLNYWDTSLYKGKLYIPYGPAPVVALYIPWRILHVGAIPENLAVIILALGALAGLLMSFLFLVNRYLPRAPLWKVVVGGTMLGLSGDIPFMLRNPSIYEASVCGGVCFTVWGLYLLGTGALGGRPIKWRLALGSLACGFAWGSHADLAVMGLLILAIAVFLWRQNPAWTRSERLRMGAAVLGPFLLIALLLASYNDARFGSLTQTGESYDVGCNCVHDKQFSPNALPEGAYMYFVAPARFTLAFPYLELMDPPPGYPGPIFEPNLQEPVGGIFALVPLTLDLFAIPLLLRRRRSKTIRELGVVSALLVATGLLIWFGVSSVGAVNVRYTIRLEADFASFLMLPAVAIWIAATGRGVVRRAFAVIGGAAAVFASIVGVCISIIGYYDGLQVSAPTTYNNLQAATSAFPTLFTKLLGRPVITAVSSIAGATAYVTNYTTLGAGNDLSFEVSPTAAEVDIVAPSTGVYGLGATLTRGPDAPHRGRFMIVIKNGSERQVGDIRTGVRSFKLHLTEGLNRVYFTATPATGVLVSPAAHEVTFSAISVVRS